MTEQKRRTFVKAVGASGIGALSTGAVAGQAESTIVVDGAGYDIWNDYDEFHYYYEEIDGDFDVTVRVDGLEDTDEYAKAGLMFRESLDADATNVMIRRTPGHDTSVQWRPETGGESTSLTADEGESESELSGGTMVADYQRLVRTDDAFLAYGSDDGENWTLMAELSTDVIDPDESGYLGLAVTSHDEGTLCAAEFSELGGVSPTHNQDLGDVSVAGSVSGDDGDDVDTNPLVATGSASDVTETTATLSGTLDSLGQASSAQVAFEYREVGAGSWTTTSGQTVTAAGSFSETVSALSSETDYEFRATVTAGDGDVDTGAVAAFATSEPDTEPVVATGEPTEVDATSATLSGTLEASAGRPRRPTSSSSTGRSTTTATTVTTSGTARLRPRSRNPARSTEPSSRSRARPTTSTARSPRPTTATSRPARDGRSRPRKAPAT